MLSRKRRAAFPRIDGGATGGPHGERSWCQGCAFSTASSWRAMRSFSAYFQGPYSVPTSIVSYERSAIVTAMIAGDARAVIARGSGSSRSPRVARWRAYRGALLARPLPLILRYRRTERGATLPYRRDGIFI